jgi:hypothetical protein
MLEDILVPAIVFMVPGATIACWLWLRLRARLAANETVRLGIEQDRPLDADAIAALTGEAPPGPERDLRRGVILVVLGLATVVFTLIDGLDPTFLGAAAFPILVGIAYIVFARTAARA